VKRSGATPKEDGHRPLSRSGATSSEAGLRVGETKRGNAEGGRSSAGRTRPCLCRGMQAKHWRFAQADGRDGEGIVARVRIAGKRCGRVDMAVTSCRQSRVGERVRFGGCGNRFGSCRGGSKVARVHMCGTVSTQSGHCHQRRIEPCARVSNNEGARRCRPSGERSACRPSERQTVSRKCRQGASRALRWARSFGDHRRRKVSMETGRTDPPRGTAIPVRSFWRRNAPDRRRTDRVFGDGGHPLAGDSRNRGASTNLQDNVRRGRSAERFYRQHGRENL
jgi:hypothetical protein